MERSRLPLVRFHGGEPGAHPVSPDALFHTDLPSLRFLKRGKVRDMYDLGEQLLIVATDRLSAFDVVLPQPIPGKGMVLTQLSNHWFGIMEAVVPNHLAVTRFGDFPRECLPYAAQLAGRSVIVRKARPFPIECVVRGYLAGSGWEEYRASGSVCAIPLPRGLRESSRLPEPVFTPATKEETGHDENISFARMESMIGSEHASMLRKLSLDVYRSAALNALGRGIIIADTKLEFGLVDGTVLLIDELLTPDSSRFWPAAEYREGGPQRSFDKQFVRDYLLSVRFDKRPPGPRLPDEVVRKTSGLYREAFFRLTGRRIGEA